ncbi:MAG TPA: hypothetical protein HA348_05535 [Thermoplasmata archaeon]|nr:hypothetical protein [Thermoplasmata archaeon]
MGRRRSTRDQFKQQMKAYRKQKRKVDNTPYMPEKGNVYLLNSLNPEEPIVGKVIKTRAYRNKIIIESIECPECGEPMKWNSEWEAFECSNHEKPRIYEVVRPR